MISPLEAVFSREGDSSIFLFPQFENFKLAILMAWQVLGAHYLILLRDVTMGKFLCDLCDVGAESAPPLVGIGLRYLKI